MYQLKSAVTVCVLGLFAVACGGDDALTPANVDLSGAWSGTSQGLQINLTLNEAQNGNLSGSGNISFESESIALTVTSGTHSGSSFSMTLEGPTGDQLNYGGDVVITGGGSGSTGPSQSAQLSGQLNGEGFNNFNITLTR